MKSPQKIASGLLILGLLGIISHSRAQDLKAKPSISLIGLNSKILVLNQDSLNSYTQTRLIRKDKDGRDHTYTGVPVSTLLAKINTPLGKDLRGKNLSQFLLVKAADDYQVIFSLPELDTEFNDNPVILASQVDGQPFPDSEGPFRIIVQNDKKPARCVRQVKELKILKAL